MKSAVKIHEKDYEKIIQFVLKGMIKPGEYDQMLSKKKKKLSRSSQSGGKDKKNLCRSLSTARKMEALSEWDSS